ncbi:hypothetical protein [Delftia sp. PS-11]|uniref:hypothetical protein n=1 Tax=Delftia sp. PS-11 TaxID=2767222 RepID=UPI002456CF3C|nr:hypothetical protein [Delftia sp. PS-11]KAJ8740635.1 hypothetical protein H9T68_23665 [Delftia sp. PS-11]
MPAIVQRCRGPAVAGMTRMRLRDCGRPHRELAKQKDVVKLTFNSLKIKYLQKNHEISDFFAAAQHEPLDSLRAIPTIRPMLHCNMTDTSSGQRRCPL